MTPRFPVPVAPVAQATATGGSPALAVVTLVAFLVATALGIAVAVRAYRGYRGSGNQRLLFLAAGIVLLSAGPTVLRLLVPTFTSLPTTFLELGTTASELAGLAAMLYAIYGNP